MPFIHNEFLLGNAAARKLYHHWAEDGPILDYHCHLPPRDIAENRRFANLFEIWLEGDHYKWRAMRANGVPENLCSGAGDPFDKFMAWASTVPSTLRNPLYHWTHLELKRYFGIDDLLDETTAPRIWEITKAKLAGDELTVWGILKKFDVRCVCTSDDPVDDLRWHWQLQSLACPAAVFPTFRPDKALTVHIPEVFNAWTEKLGEAANLEIRTWTDFLEALRRRHDFFHTMGCRLSDHGLAFCPPMDGTEAEAATAFQRARLGVAASSAQQQRFAGFLMRFFGRLDAEKGWTKQLHLGARRGNSTRGFMQAGPDSGFDSIGDWPQIDALGAYLDALERENSLPKMVLYNLNPGDFYAFATMAGNFMGGRTGEAAVAGRIQLGSGWWFLDQKEGIEAQLNALSNCGLLARFIGMLTDSRSFMSFPRHEYFRRVLANLLGRDMEQGLIPDREEPVGTMIRGICYSNARSFLGLSI
ncbi:MAG: glucuronate isomerase [Bryobacteraceae bacterium]